MRHTHKGGHRDRHREKGEGGRAREVKWGGGWGGVGGTETDRQTDRDRERERDRDRQTEFTADSCHSPWPELSAKPCVGFKRTCSHSQPAKYRKCVTNVDKYSTGGNRASSHNLHPQELLRENSAKPVNHQSTAFHRRRKLMSHKKEPKQQENKNNYTLN